MSDWNNPATTQTIANYTTAIRDMTSDLALMFDGVSATNLPTSTIRWSSSGDKWEIWGGASWTDLSSLYDISVTKLNGVLGSGYVLAAHAGAGGAVHADATTSVSGFLSGADKTIIDALGAVSTESIVPIAKGGTNAATEAAARTNLGLGTSAIVNTGSTVGLIPLIDTGDKYPAIDGSLITNLINAPGIGAAAALAVTAGGSAGALRSDGSGANLTAITGKYVKTTTFSGSGTFTKQSESKQIVGMIFGPGGGGAGGGGSNGGGGGGAGGFCHFTRDVTSESSHAVVLGNGGAGGASSTDGSDGSADSTFKFSATTIATGFLGLKGIAGSGTKLGGAGGAGSGLTILKAVTGQAGTTGDGNIGGRGGDNGGSFGFGGAAGVGSAAAHNAEIGGGGGGGGKSASGGFGGDGYCIIVEYT